MSMLNDMNDELLLRVFQFLEAPNLAFAQATCKRWHDLTEDYTLWRGLCYSLRLGGQRVFRFHAASASPPSPSTKANGLLYKPAFKLDKFGLDPELTNWKVLYQRLRTASHFVGNHWQKPQCSRLHTTVAQAFDAAQQGEFVYVLPGIYYCDVDEAQPVMPKMDKVLELVGLGKGPADVVLQDRRPLRIPGVPRGGENDDNEDDADQTATDLYNFSFVWSVMEIFSGHNGDDGDREGLAVASVESASRAGLRATRQAIRGVTFMGSTNHAICIGDGSQLLLENCGFTHDHKESKFGAATAVNIYGSGTSVTLRNCIIHDSKKHGVFVGEDAKATLINVEINGTAHSGIHVRSNGRVTIEGGKIHNCRQHGVYVNDGARAVVRNCEICDVRGKAVQSSPRACEIVLDNNNVHDCLEHDVGGTTSAEDCLLM